MLARKRRAQLLHDLVVIEPFDRHYFGIDAGRRIGDTGARRNAVNEHRASTAHTVLATQMGASKVVDVTDIIGEAGSRLHIRPNSDTVERERYIGHAATALATARRSATTRTVCSMASP